jgi:ribosomal protein S18 acetylase RimI-like enzyme
VSGIHLRDDVEMRHFGRAQFHAIRRTLVDVYLESYPTDDLASEFYSRRSFEGRLDGHVKMRGWECVIGYARGEAAGYAYGYSAPPGGSSWHGLRTQAGRSVLEETGRRTFDLGELMVLPPWRKTGIARAIHDELMAYRPEERASLFVDQRHVRVRALYERWGYRWVGEVVPTVDSPVFDAMILQIA